MNVFLAVIEDLTSFVAYWFRRMGGGSEPTKALIAPPARKALPPRQQILIEEMPIESPDQGFTSIKEVMADHHPIATEVSSETAVVTEVGLTFQEELVVGARNVLLFMRPTKEFDAVQKKIPYGANLVVHEQRGNWAKVTYQESTGWVSRDTLVAHQAQVRPFFVIKEYCDQESDVTRRLRNVIEDEFCAGAAELPLHAEEYVYYRLLVRGIVLPRTAQRPRLAGTWQKIFSGERGVHIGVRPKTGTVMEYVDENEVGHVAYVEAVFPDESVSVSEVGDPHEGYYNERTLGKEVWQQLSPVFIQFS